MRVLFLLILSNFFFGIIGCLDNNRAISGRYYRNGRMNEFYDIDFENETFRHQLNLTNCCYLDSGTCTYLESSSDLILDSERWPVSDTNCSSTLKNTSTIFYLREGVLDLGESSFSYLMDGYHY
jgi:hypothetical protein